MQRWTHLPEISPRLALGLVLAAAACTPRDFDDTTSTVLTDSDASTTSTSTGPTSLGSTTSTVTTVDPSATDSSSTTTGTDTDGSSTSTTGEESCNFDLVCDVDEDADGCLHDCGGCEPDGICKDTAETPYACPSDCDASACDLNGSVDALSEQCDDGNADNNDACTDACRHNVCGDGLLFPVDKDGSEECDDGNMIDEDGCSTKCIRAHRIVFVSSTVYAGNLLPGIDNLSGLALADGHCQQLADAANLPGSYLAWLSSGVSAPSERFDVTAGFAGRYELVDATLVAESWDEFTGGTLAHAIDLDENGAPVQAAVWTNTASNGNSKGSFDCEGWTSADFNSKGGVGTTQALNKQWTDADVVPCSVSARLYCVQVSEG